MERGVCSLGAFGEVESDPPGGYESERRNSGKVFSCLPLYLSVEPAGSHSLVIASFIVPTMAFYNR